MSNVFPKVHPFYKSLYLQGTVNTFILNRHISGGLSLLVQGN